MKNESLRPHPLDIVPRELTDPTCGKGISSSNIPWVGICFPEGCVHIDPGKLTNDNGKPIMNEDVSPIKHGDFPLSFFFRDILGGSSHLVSG